MADLATTLRSKKVALVGDLFIDVLVRVAWSEPLAVTTEPIEDGSEVADHVYEQQKTLVLDCVFVDDVFAYYGDDPELLALRAQAHITTAADKRAAAYAIKRAKTPVNVTTGKDYFESLLLVDIQEEQTAQTSKGFVASLIFVEVKTVELARSKVPLETIKDADKKSARKKQEPTTDVGKQTGEEVNNNTGARNLVAPLFGLQ